jgi:hypothetical protein
MIHRLTAEQTQKKIRECISWNGAISLRLHNDAPPWSSSEREAYRDFLKTNLKGLSESIQEDVKFINSDVY